MAKPIKKIITIKLIGRPKSPPCQIGLKLKYVNITIYINVGPTNFFSRKFTKKITKGVYKKVEAKFFTYTLF